jgi:hypothetical protein
LREAALEDIITNIKTELDGTALDTFSEEYNNIQNTLADKNLEVGATLDDSKFIESCNAMILAAGLSADEVNDLFSGMGYDVTFDEEPQEVSTAIPQYTTTHKIGNRQEEEING